MEKDKRYIPGTNPKWGRELPEGMSNSLVDKNGYNWDNGYNFDERDDPEPEEEPKPVEEADGWAEIEKKS